MTTAELEKVMREAFRRMMLQEDEAEVAIEVHRLAGWLNENKPQWIRDSAAIYYQNKAKN